MLIMNKRLIVIILFISLAFVAAPQIHADFPFINPNLLKMKIPAGIFASVKTD